VPENLMPRKWAKYKQSSGVSGDNSHRKL